MQTKNVEKEKKDMKKESIKKLKAFVYYKVNKNESQDYFMRRDYFNEFVLAEHDKGHRPVEYIERDYFEELGLNVSLEFFKWYLLNHCKPCETYIAYDIKPLEFYDIVECAKKLKSEDIKKLKKEYKSFNNIHNIDAANNDNSYYFAEVEYSKKPSKGIVVKYKDYAIVLGNWAYFDPNSKYKRVSVPENPTRYDNKIIKKYSRRPSQMSQEVADSILNKLSKTHKDLQLEKIN